MTLECKHEDNKEKIIDLNGISCDVARQDNRNIESWYGLGYSPNDDYNEVVADRVFIGENNCHTDKFNHMNVN